jgi:hypothetical protein
MFRVVRAVQRIRTGSGSDRVSTQYIIILSEETQSLPLLVLIRGLS